jgi:hypothetical protein
MLCRLPSSQYGAFVPNFDIPDFCFADQSAAPVHNGLIPQISTKLALKRRPACSQ